MDDTTIKLCHLPFKGWVEVEDLRTGMRVHKADGTTTGTVWLKWNVYKAQEMYNLTVDTAHTFFVGEGQWLVHNECDPDVVRYPTDACWNETIPPQEKNRLQNRH